MVKIKNSDISSFLQDSYLIEQSSIILLFGPNEGLVHTRATQIKEVFFQKEKDNNNSNNTEIIVFTAESIINNQSLFFNTLYNFSIFDTKKTYISIVQPTNQLIDYLRSESLQKYFDEQFNRNCASINFIIVIQAGELNSQNNLRLFFENHKKYSSVGCYADLPTTTNKIIRNLLRKENMTIDKDAFDALLSVLGNDYLIANQEIEKLILYCYKEKHIKKTDVETCVVYYGSDTLDAIVDEAFSGYLSDGFSFKFFSLYRRNPHFSASLLVSSILMHTRRLLKALCLKREKVNTVINTNTSNKNNEDIMRQLRPPVHFLRKKHFSEQMTRWHEAELMEIVYVFVKLNYLIKQNNYAPYQGLLLIYDCIYKHILKYSKPSSQYISS